jgi:hypothetical protein
MSDSEELDSGVKGKQGELKIIGSLLERGFPVYSPMVDTGFDCIIDTGNGDYKEIQIKTRSKTPLFQVKDTKPRENFYIICYLMLKNEVWVLPSKVFFEDATKVKGKNGRILHRLTIGKEGSKTYEELRRYRDNYAQLKGQTGKEPSTGTGRPRVEGDHFTQGAFEEEILRILVDASTPIAAAEIINIVKLNLSYEFSKADNELVSNGRPRWEATARFALYQGLKKKGLIEAKGKNQYIITQLGRQALKPDEK